MSLPRVKLYGDWNQDSGQMIDNLKLFTEGFDGDVYDDSIEFVREGEHDHTIVFNFPRVPPTTPPQNNIGLILEPPEILQRMYPRWVKMSSVPNVEHYYAFSSGTRFPHVPGIGFATASFHLYEMPDRAGVCMIASQKRFTPWHEKRHEILDALLKSDLDIHFYGRNMPELDDIRVQGEIPPGLKRLVTKRYDYVIDFENSSHGAVTDKFFDPILTEAMPVTNATILESLVPRDSFRLVDFNKSTQEIVEDIATLTEKPPTEGEKESIREAKAEITSGSMSLTKWIRDRVVELYG